MEPIVNGLEDEYGDQMTFQYLNAAAEGRQLFQRYNLRGHPSYIILNTEGDVVWRLVGEVPRETLTGALQEALN